MTIDQALVLILFTGLFAMFVWGRWRYDLVAITALIAAVFMGLVPAGQAFSGFGHPAVITVAAVLIVSRALSVSGAIERLTAVMLPPVRSLTAHIGLLSGVGAVLSAFMNNIGALALLMPATIDAAKKSERPPALLLMPLSFGTILGGLITLIGTPPNIIIANVRTDVAGQPFAMFDFAPVGLTLAVLGVAYLALIGWRLVPKERQAKSAGEELFDIDAYVTEVKVVDGAKAVGRSVAELDDVADACDVRIAGLIRARKRILRTSRATEVMAGDIIILEADPAGLDRFAHKLGLEIVGDAPRDRALLSSTEVALTEAVVSPDSRMIGRITGQMRLKSRYGLNLLGVSRQGTPVRRRLHKVIFQSGDVLLLQGDADSMHMTMTRLGLLPLASRGMGLGQRGQAWLALSFLAAAVAAASSGLIPLPIAFAAAAVAVVASNIVPLRDVYDSVDWPVIVLLGALIPVGQALQTTGATALIADAILALASGTGPVLVLVLIMVVTMTLSDIMNNAATAVVMAPIAITLSDRLGVSSDPFLMAVAVAASCAFLTPIGHQNNALVMGPGGYRFGDYWRVGLPLEVLIVALGVPMILWVWPL